VSLCFALSKVDSYLANSTAIKAAIRVGKLAHNAVEQRKHHNKRSLEEQRKHHNKRSLESYEDLDTREPIKGKTVVSVALFIYPFARGVAEKMIL
jgi:hypothetical protein